MTLDRVGCADAPDEGAAAALRRARALIAAAFNAPTKTDLSAGEVVLREHQRSAVDRLHPILERAGGAVLADATGLGKTYVALAVALRYRRVLVAGPAALRDSWEVATRRTGVRATFVSLERLSRQDAGAAAGEYDLVIVDEAHHLRTTTTRRYAAMAELTRRARVLLLSATPVQNRRDDLLALLALFLGERAHGFSDTQAAEYVVRRTRVPSETSLPALEGPYWVTLGVRDDDCLDALVALPPPVPAADEGDGGVLLLYTLARQWASSRAALVAALRRRLARGAALEAALAAGQLPTRHDLAAWAYADGAVQLAFAELLSADTIGASRTASLLASVRAHTSAVRELLSRLARSADPDEGRADALRAIRARSAGARVIAFAQFSETVRALARLLSRDAGIAELTAHGARVAGGRISRREVLAQFGPGGRKVPHVERIDLLLSTDVLSEGLDLQQAMIVVHLDLPWNPARLEQRVGRIRRLGSPHERVIVHALAPPAAPERLLRLEERLRHKIGVAARLIGLTDPVIPDLARESGIDVVGQAGALSQILATWNTGSAAIEHQRSVGPDPAFDHLVVGAVVCPREGWLARVDEAEGAVLVAELGDGPSTSPDVLARAAAFASGDPAVVDSALAADALGALARWWSLRRGEKAIPLDQRTKLRRQLAVRIDSCIERAPRSRRAGLAALGSRARTLLSMTLGAGAERRIADASRIAADDESWLRSLAEIAREEGAARGRGAPEELRRQVSVPVRALILLQPAPACATAGTALGSAVDQDGPPDEEERATARR